MDPSGKAHTHSMYHMCCFGTLLHVTQAINLHPLWLEQLEVLCINIVCPPVIVGVTVQI